MINLMLLGLLKQELSIQGCAPSFPQVFMKDVGALGQVWTNCACTVTMVVMVGKD